MAQFLSRRGGCGTTGYVVTAANRSRGISVANNQEPAEKLAVQPAVTGNRRKPSRVKINSQRCEKKYGTAPRSKFRLKKSINDPLSCAGNLSQQN